MKTFIMLFVLTAALSNAFAVQSDEVANDGMCSKERAAKEAESAASGIRDTDVGADSL